jgi:hypothetical protein
MNITEVLRSSARREASSNPAPPEIRTKSWVEDGKFNKVFLNDTVEYENKYYEVLDFQYLSRSPDAVYLRLRAKNGHKTLDFIDAKMVVKIQPRRSNDNS